MPRWSSAKCYETQSTMPRASPILSWTLAAQCGLGCAGRSSDETEVPPAPAGITAQRLHAGVDRFICAEWSPEVQAWGGPQFDERCPQPAASTELARTVRAAVARIRPMVMLSEAAGQSFERAIRGQPASAQSTADASAREAFWRDPELSRAIALALNEELGARKLQCEDCQPIAASPPQGLPWSAFLPYLSAYLWAHDGEGAKIEIHMCSGVNGTKALAPDQRLLHAGVLTAFAFAMDETMAAQIHRIAETSPSVDAAANALQALLNAPAGRAHACAALADIAWFTGLYIDECPRMPGAPSP